MVQTAQGRMYTRWVGFFGPWVCVNALEVGSGFCYCYYWMPWSDMRVIYFEALLHVWCVR